MNMVVMHYKRGVPVLLFVFLSLVACQPADDGVAVDPLSTAPQAVEERVFTHRPVDPVRLTTPDTDSLIYAVQFEIADSSLWVYDGGARHIRRFSLDGESLATIISGTGEAPGEVRQASDFYVHDSYVWVLEPNVRALHQYEHDGTYIDEVRVPDLSLRARPVTGGVVHLTLMGPEPLLKADAAGEEVAYFDLGVDLEPSNPMALSGYLASLPNGGFAYIPAHAGLIVFYDSDGQRVLSRQTIDGHNLPEASDRGNQARTGFSAVSGDIRYRGGYVVDNELRFNVWFKQALPMDYHSAIDRYDVNTGAYLGSIQMPVDFLFCSSTHTDLYCALDGGITRYRLERVSAEGALTS